MSSPFERGIVSKVAASVKPGAAAAPVVVTPKGRFGFRKTILPLEPVVVKVGDKPVTVRWTRGRKPNGIVGSYGEFFTDDEALAKALASLIETNPGLRIYPAS